MQPLSEYGDIMTYKCSGDRRSSTDFHQREYNVSCSDMVTGSFEDLANAPQCVISMTVWIILTNVALILKNAAVNCAPPPDPPTGIIRKRGTDISNFKFSAYVIVIACYVILI